MIAASADRLRSTSHTSAYRYLVLTALVVAPLTLLPLVGLPLGAHATLLWKRRMIVLMTSSSAPSMTARHSGPVNLLVLVPITGALYAWRAGREAVAEALLAAAVWAKLFPLALVALAAWRARRRLLGSLALAGSAILPARRADRAGQSPEQAQPTALAPAHATARRHTRRQ